MIPKKVRYVPGLISLIGLPILLLFFGPEDEVQQTVLKHNMPSNVVDTTGELYTKSFVYEEIKNYKIIEVDLWEKPSNTDENKNIYINNKRLEFLKCEMQRLRFTYDTTTALKVELSEGNTYGEFVWLINQATILGLKRYSYIADDFYFFANDPPIDYSKLPPLEPLYLEAPVLIGEPYQPPSKWEIFVSDLKYEFEEIAYMLKRNMLLAVGFLMLIIIPAIVKLLMRRRQGSQLV